MGRIPHCTMLANVTVENLQAIGASDVADFQNKFSALLTEHNRLKSMAESSPDLSALTKRIEALEAKPNLTEARVSELVTAGVTPAITSWAASDDGKKLIGAQASKITMEAMAAVGTQPVKPSPAPALAGDQFDNLEAQGKFAEAYALKPELRAEFPDAGSYASYRKNAHKVRISNRN
jgi:hypothetical protein